MTQHKTQQNPKTQQQQGQQDIIQSQWSQIQSQVKNRWTDLTDNDLQRAEGSHDYLVDTLQKRCNFSLEKAEREVSSFEQELRSSQTNQQTHNASSSSGRERSSGSSQR